MIKSIKLIQKYQFLVMIITPFIPLLIILCSLLNVGFSQRYYKGPLKNITNIFWQNEQYLLKVWVQKNEENVFSKDYQLRYSLKQQQVSENITLNVQDLNSNISIHASLFKIKRDQSLLQIAFESKNLTRFQRIRKLVDESTGGGSYDPIDQIAPKNEVQNNQSQSKYALHVAKDFNIMVIYADVVFNENNRYPPNMNIQLLQDDKYTCGVDLSQMHIPFRSYSKIQEKEYNITLHIFPYDILRYAAFYSLAHPQKMWQQFGPMGEVMKLSFDESTMDQMKQILFTNHIYLVVTFFLLSLSQTILKFFTIKQQYKFWKDIDKNQGVSLKTLFYELIFSTILTLYVYQYNSSKLIIGFSILDIAITVWKISKTFKIRIKSQFPFLSLQATQLYKKREKIDTQAIWYLNYLLIPLMFIYLGWSLYSKNFIIKSYYIFFLQTSVAFIAIFGFIMMTPQLYINYKLKSVEHMNWKGLIYRFINTLLDDLFAFMVTMPTMRRIMYFRDDVIFICYIYQRWIYRVDYNRRAPQSQDHKSQSLKQE